MAGDERLIDAAFKRDLALVKELLDNGVAVNNRDSFHSTALEYAAGFGQRDMVSMLIQHGADVTGCNLWGETPLTCAVDNGHTDIEKMLRDAGAVE